MPSAHKECHEETKCIVWETQRTVPKVPLEHSTLSLPLSQMTNLAKMLYAISA